ncbi:MAG: hypothetical protein JO169_04635 [Solirubrobacterales bacterium]|nr:hypothetical protein [Solirubrobacterales bacterium]
MASQKSKRRSRKRRDGAAAPRAVSSQRREQRAQRELVAARQRRRARRTLGTEGQRPPSPFGGLPISELAIFAGGVALIIGLVQGGPAVLVGLVVCALGVMEITAREHFSGYRSHSALLAAIPAVAVEVGLVQALGAPRHRGLLLLVVVPVFAALFWLLRRRFLAARQARVARPPAP